MAEKRKIYSVVQISKEIKDLLSEAFDSIWIEGEISNFTESAAGHMYGRLKEEKSLIKFAFFKGSNSKWKGKLKDGMKVVVHGRIDTYGGDYQVIIDELEEAGLGDLHERYLKLCEKLKKEGLFEEARKRPIPQYPQKIGIVTSPTGAAIQDILSVFKRRSANVHMVLNPVKVQGEGSAEEIAAAIEELNRIGGFEVIIVGRGGGSIEDLWSFNEEIVARAIFNSKIPVISAVGHEIDYTIADFTADLRAATPTVAAELVVKDRKDIIAVLESNEARMRSVLGGMFNAFKEKLDWIRKTGLAGGLKRTLEIFKERLLNIAKSAALARPKERVDELRQELDDLDSSIKKAYKHFIELKNRELELAASKLNGLNPLKILERGYSVTVNKATGVIIKDSKAVSKGEEIEVRVAKGILDAKVTETK